MIIKKINGTYLPEADRVLLKITVENDDLRKDQFQFIFTRKIVKSMIQVFKTRIQHKLVYGTAIIRTSSGPHQMRLKFVTT